MPSPLKLLILLVPFLIVVLFQFPVPPWPDAIMYDSIARDFLRSSIFRCAIFQDFDPVYLQANCDNGPVFNFLHLIILKIFGSTDHRLILLLNYTLVLLSTWNVAKVLKLHGREYYILCLVTFNPLVVHSANLIRPEWLNVYFLSWIWRLFACHYGRLPRPCSALITGFVLALTAQTHYFSIFFIPIIVYQCWISEETLWPRVKTGLEIALATALFLTPYVFYILYHMDAFRTEVLINQFGANASHSVLKFLQHMLQPLFFPSSTIYTESNIIPRWLPVLFHLSMVAVVSGFIIKWRRHIVLSPTTRQAIMMWLLVNLGTAMVSYTPYVIFYFSVVAVALWRDLLPHLQWDFRKVLVSVIAASLTYSVFFDFLVARKLFNWKDYQNTVQCLSQQLPAGATVYVLAYPDPSVALSNLRQDLSIRRYSDFVRYKDQWAEITHKIHYFTTSEDGRFITRFDFGFALRDQIAAQQFQRTSCSSGPIHYILWSRR